MKIFLGNVIWEAVKPSHEKFYSVKFLLRKEPQLCYLSTKTFKIVDARCEPILLVKFWPPDVYRRSKLRNLVLSNLLCP